MTEVGKEFGGYTCFWPVGAVEINGSEYLMLRIAVLSINNLKKCLPPGVSKKY